MKWMVLLLTVFSLHLSAAVHGQTVTFSGKNVPLRVAFEAIQQQTGYAVFFNQDVIDKAMPVTVRAKNETVERFLDMVLKGQDLRFEIVMTTVLIIRKEASRASEEKPAAPVKASPPLVTGKITDPNGTPLSGVSIRVKGTRRGATTDAKGNFTIQAGPGDVLIVSYVGMAEVTLEVMTEGARVLSSTNDAAGEKAPRPVLSVIGGDWLLRMAEATTRLDEIQVIAYGTTSQRLNPGNVFTVTAKEIEKQPVTNPLLALVGRVPGLIVSQVSGVAGGAVKVMIQGQRSISSGNDPFYVIDGIPYATAMPPVSDASGILGRGGGGWNSSVGYATLNNANTSAGNPMAFINPADIESITVLKDAEATSIYGSRAANGAILITTKKGKAGPTRIDLNAQSGWGRPTRMMKLLNTKQYLEIRREALKNDGVSPQPTDYDLNGTWDTTRYTDWQKEIIGNTARFSTYSANISGGSATMQGLIGATYNRTTSVFIGGGADQAATVHFSLNSATSDKKLSTAISGSYQVDNNDLPRTDLTEVANQLPPNAPALLNPDGSINWAPDANGASTLQFNHPIAIARGRYVIKTNNLTSNMTVSYVPVRGLTIKSTVGFNNLQGNSIVRFPLTIVNPEERPYASRAANYNSYGVSTWSIEPQVTYSNRIGAGKLDVLAALSFQETHSKSATFMGTGYSSDDLLGSIQAAAMLMLASQSEYLYRNTAAFGRINYTLMDRYILEATVRRDGSSRFGPENRMHTFASAGAAWIFSNAELIRRQLPWLSFGKVKVSYGTTGNDQIGDYAYLSLYNPAVPSVPYQGTPGLVPSGLANPLLQWEEVQKLNAGLELGMLKDRVLLTGNFYFDRSSRQLMGASVPTITGFFNIPVNRPTLIHTYGWEVTLHAAVVRSKDFQLTTDLNVTIPKSKVVSIDFTNYPGGQLQSPYVGKSIGTTLLFKYGGVNPQTGIYEMINAKGGRTSDPVWPDDLIAYVDMAKKYLAGLHVQASYRSFTLEMQLNYSRGYAPNMVYNLAGSTGGRRNQGAFILDRWQKPGDISYIQRVSAGRGPQGYNDFGAGLSDATVRNGSYGRLQNASLYWSVPERWLKKTGIGSVSFYTQGQNLMTFTSYLGMDPENANGGSLPPLRIWTFGAKLQF